MIKTKQVLKVAAAWVSIVFVICYLGVALIPSIRSGFMKYGLHVDIDMGRDILTFGTFISGLIIWNVIAFVAVWLFATLYNNIKE